MRGTKAIVTLVITTLLIGAPLLIHRRLSAKDKLNDELVNRYECPSLPCGGDFDGDGTPGHVVREPYERSLVVIDGEQELLRLPFEVTAHTLRTHVAMRNEDAKARLLIYDGTGSSVFEAVFAWDGERMFRVIASDEDDAIISAMRARDESGELDFWSLYRSGSQIFYPLTTCYWAVLSSSCSA